MTAGPKKTTMKDIAEVCNVSSMAVSKVLNGKEGISKETTERIFAAAKKLNYRPNLIAKSLRINETRTLGVITSDSSHLLFAKILRAIGDAADENDYSIIIANTGQCPKRERKSMQTLIEKRIDGLLLAAPLNVDRKSMNNVRNLDIPVTLLMRSAGPGYDTVINDNYLGAYQMVDYLAKTGSRRFYMINLPRESQSGKERLRGYKRALKDNGIEYNARGVLFCQPYIEDGRIAMQKLLDKGARSGAVFCGCDVIAIGAIRAAIKKGLQIPGDIRISGYDDIELLDDLRVPLTTMRQPVLDMGRAGIDLLLRRIREPNRTPQRLVMQSELVVREST